MIDFSEHFLFPNDIDLSPETLLQQWAEPEVGFGWMLMGLVSQAEDRRRSGKAEDRLWLSEAYRVWLRDGQYKVLDEWLQKEDEHQYACPNPERANEVETMTAREWLAVAILGLARVVAVDANTQFNRLGRPQVGDAWSDYVGIWADVEGVAEYYGVDEDKAPGVTIHGNPVDWRFEFGQDKVKHLELVGRKVESINLAEHFRSELLFQEGMGELSVAGESSLAVVDHRMGALTGDFRYLVDSLRRIRGVVIKNGDKQRLRELHEMSLKVLKTQPAGWLRHPLAGFKVLGMTLIGEKYIRLLI